MQISQVYDIFVNNFYLSVFNIKWLFYEINEIPVLLFIADMLQKTFDLLLSQISFSSIQEYEKKHKENYVEIIKNEWKNFLV